MKIKKKIKKRNHPTLLILLVITAIGAKSSLANDLESCFVSAADRYQVPARLLKAITKTESNFEISAINDANWNDSVDYGLMQINSQHLERLKPYNITKSVLVENPCANINAGAWILAENLATAKGDLWLAIGAYNAGFRKTSKAEQARQRYITKIRRALKSTTKE